MVMTGKDKALSPELRELGDDLTQFLIEYLQGNTPEGTLDEVYRLVEAARKVALCNGEGAWSPFAERRSLLEAAGVVLGGGPDTLAEVGRCVFDTIRRPEIMELLQTLGSPGAVYQALPNFLDLYELAFRMATEMLGPNECRIEIRMRAPNEPFRELCAFGLGMTSTLPQLFGFSVADITHESCQCDGDPCCSALLRWDAAQGPEAEARRAEMRIRVLEARLDELQGTVAELGSGDGLPHVLTRVMAGATRAVEAPKFVLDIKASASSRRFIRTKGIDEAEGAAVTRTLREAGTEPAANVLVTDVVSERGHYGYLVAIRSGANSFEPRERSVLESYARLAASALDSEAAVIEARRQAETAQALLALSSSLADFATSDEMAQHLAQTIPSVIDCDRAIVSLAGQRDDLGLRHVRVRSPHRDRIECDRHTQVLRKSRFVALPAPRGCSGRGPQRRSRGGRIPGRPFPRHQVERRVVRVDHRRRHRAPRTAG